MPRPTSKDQLLALSSENYEKLHRLIDSISPEDQEREFSFADRDRNLRDVLAHLHHWHKMMMEWYQIGMGGSKPIMPAPGYTWLTLPALNQEIWQAYQSTSLAEAKRLLDASHGAVMDLIAGHSDAELFTKKIYQWTNTTSLGSCFISATSSHYDWAIKKIKRFKKELTT